jgi:hypothetical protein
VRRPHRFGAVVTLVLLGACAAGPNTASPSSPTKSSRAPSSPLADQWCGATKVQRGTPPEWTRSAPTGLRFVVSQHHDVAGFLFADPLVAPPDRVAYNNKVLWVVRLPRLGTALVLDGAGPTGASPVHLEHPADSGPGEIYPSIVDVPSPGCWHFTLQWAGHTDEVDLRYVPAR